MLCSVCGLHVCSCGVVLRRGGGVHVLTCAPTLRKTTVMKQEPTAYDECACTSTLQIRNARRCIHRIFRAPHPRAALPPLNSQLGYSPSCRASAYSFLLFSSYRSTLSDPASSAFSVVSLGTLQRSCARFLLRGNASSGFYALSPSSLVLCCSYSR